MKIIVEYEVEDQILKDILVAAVEGGSNYWWDEHPPKRVERDEDLNVTVLEFEKHSLINYCHITPQDLTHAIQELLSSGELQFQDLDNHDAAIADLILQQAVFGTQVYC